MKEKQFFAYFTTQMAHKISSLFKSQFLAFEKMSLYFDYKIYEELCFVKVSFMVLIVLK